MYQKTIFLEGLPIIPPRQAGVEIFDCPSDWLLISAVRLCGERLNDGSVLQDFESDAPVTKLNFTRNSQISNCENTYSPKEKDCPICHLPSHNYYKHNYPLFLSKHVYLLFHNEFTFIYTT